jgi:hypothetical protein
LDHGEEQAHAEVLEMLVLRHRTRGLRSVLAGRRVLIAGRLARSIPLQKLLCGAGARLMAARDLETALGLARRFEIDVVLAATPDTEDELEPFEREFGPGHRSRVSPMLVRLPSPAPSP